MSSQRKLVCLPMHILQWRRSKMYASNLLRLTASTPVLTKIRIQDGTTTTKTFVHTPSIIEAEEAEEIGVEHLLRDIRDVAVGTLSTRITSQLQSLQGLHLRLRDIGTYLQKVLDKELPVNHVILGNLQDVFNLLPNLGTAPTKNGSSPTGFDDNSDLARAMSIKR